MDTKLKNLGLNVLKPLRYAEQTDGWDEVEL